MEEVGECIMKKALSVMMSLILICSVFSGCDRFYGENEATESDIVFEISGEEDETAETLGENIDYSKCEDILNSMSVEEKISQMIMPAFRYYTDDYGQLEAVTEINDDIRECLNSHGFAGVILFAQNISDCEQTVRLIDSLQTANAANDDRPQLFVAVDQEGGSITRIDFGTSFCGNMALGATGDPENARVSGEIIGSELSALGFNVDFAPVVDVNNNPSNPIIGVRSFSDDAEMTSMFGKAFMQGLQTTGVAASLKHFPGHGDTSTDSHTGLPCINKTYDELKENELLPFKSCSDSGADMIMTAHIQFPLIESETYTSVGSGEEVYLPATLSKTIVTDILRNDIGYDGVVITDGMLMDAIAQNFSILDSARLAFGAGVDILLMPVDTSSKYGIDELEGYISDIATLVEDGEIPSENIDSSVMRILKLKQRKGLLEKYDGSEIDKKIETAKTTVGSSENRLKEWETAKKSITLLKNENGTLPIKSPGGKTVVLTADADENEPVEYVFSLLKSEGKIPETAEVSVLCYSYYDTETLRNEIYGAENVIALSKLDYAAQLNPYGSYGYKSASLDTLIDTAHENGASFTLISCGLPYDAARYGSADAIMIAWMSKGMSEDSRIEDGDLSRFGASIPAAIYMAFSEDESPSGKLPLDIPALDDYYAYSDEILYERGYGISYR